MKDHNWMKIDGGTLSLLDPYQCSDCGIKLLKDPSETIASAIRRKATERYRIRVNPDMNTPAAQKLIQDLENCELQAVLQVCNL